MRRCVPFVLTLALTGVLTAQTLPKVWNRATDWVDQKNPHPDSKGNLVWFAGHNFGSRGTYAQWNTAWKGWTMKHSSAYYNDADPVTQVALNDYTLYTLWRRYFFVTPQVELRNTTKEAFLAAVEGKAVVHWAAWMSPKAPNVNADVFIKHYDTSTGKWTMLQQIVCLKPSNSTKPENRSYTVKTATVRMDPGDRIRIRLAARFQTATDSRMVLFDKDVSIVRKSLAEAKEIVRHATPKNPLTLKPGRTSRPLLGKMWDPYVANPPAGAKSSLLALGVTKLHAATPFGTLLTDPLAVVSSQPGASFALPIPNSPALAGVTFSAQGAAVTASGGLLLANALDVRLGDF